MPTSFQQNVRFRNIPEQIISEFDFRGGLVKDSHETKLEPNQSPEMANVLFNDTGSIKTRNGYLRHTGDVIGSSSDESNTGSSTGTVTLDSPGDYVAQTFQVGTLASMVQVDFFLAMTNSSEEQYVRAELWSGDTGPDEVIYSSQVLLISGTDETEYSFRFLIPQSLAATTEYAVVLKPFIRGSTQTVNSVEVHRTGTAYANGAAYSSTDSGLSWSAISNVDLKFNVYTGGATGGTGFIRYYNDTGTQQSFVKFGSSLYRVNDSTGATTAITLGSGATFSSGNFLDWTIADNALLVVDNLGRIQKYRGSTNANYSTGTISVTEDSTSVVGSGTSWATTTNAEVGEYIKLPDGKWYKIVTITDDTNLVIEVAYQGATDTGEAYVISPWGEVQGKLNSVTPPVGATRPQPKFIETHLNRVWATEGNVLRFSVLDTSVDEENFNDWDTAQNAGAIVVPSGEGDTITGLYSANGYLYVFQRNAIWELFGNSPANFELRNINNEIGMTDKRTLVEYDRYMIFLSHVGVVLFDGVNITNITDGVINSYIDSWANLTSPAAVLWDNKYLLSFTPSGESSNSRAIYYDINLQIFGEMRNVPAGIWSAWNGGTDTGQIYFVSSNQGSIYRWNTGGHDDGYPIYTLYDTGSLGFGAGINDKAMKKFYIQQLAKGDWDMTVTQYANISETITPGTAINLSAGSSSLWDVFEWDEGEWSGEGTLLTNRIAEFQGLAKYFRFRMEQTGYNEGIEVLAIVTTSRLRRLQ